MSTPRPRPPARQNPSSPAPRSRSSSMARPVADTDSRSSADETTAIASSSAPNYTNPPPKQLQSTRRAEDSDSKPTGFLRRFGAIELENKGSVARDHLALERTFLAWLRTSLAFASIGIAVTQLFRLNTSIRDDDPTLQKLRHVGKPLGATFLGVSLVVLVVGVNRYYESQTWLLRGKFPASRGSVFLLTAIASALIVASLVIVIAISPTSFET